jgi:hypothetical protein
VWLVELHPRALTSSPDLIPAIGLIIPEGRFDAFAARHGGVDVRQLAELTVAAYPGASLVLARGPFDPGRVEKAFTERASPIETRALERTKDAEGRPFEPIVHLVGSNGAAREQLALLGREALAFEHADEGRPAGPLRAAKAFAQERLKKSPSALRADPLARAAARLEGAPARFFAPGPFEGEWARGFGGLLRASTGFAGGAWPIPSRPGETSRGRLDVRLVVLGTWKDDASAAAERLAASFQLLAEDPLGHLCGLDRPVAPLHTRADADALTLDVGLDAMALARGLRSATGASLDEIMAR